MMLSSPFNLFCKCFQSVVVKTCQDWQRRVFGRRDGEGCTGITQVWSGGRDWEDLVAELEIVMSHLFKNSCPSERMTPTLGTLPKRTRTYKKHQKTSIGAEFLSSVENIYLELGFREKLREEWLKHDCRHSLGEIGNLDETQVYWNTGCETHSVQNDYLDFVLQSWINWFTV